MQENQEGEAAGVVGVAGSRLKAAQTATASEGVLGNMAQLGSCKTDRWDTVGDCRIDSHQHIARYQCSASAAVTAVLSFCKKMRLDMAWYTSSGRRMKSGRTSRRYSNAAEARTGLRYKYFRPLSPGAGPDTRRDCKVDCWEQRDCHYRQVK
jgi:hypothetical protein